MDLVRDIADWIATGWGDRLGFLFPLGVIGLLGLYVLWLVIGYLRVSQVGLADARQPREVVPMRSTEPAERPRGAPYCAFDGLQYPVGARFCTSCERDLMLDCINCGATLAAADATCYRCGTRTGAADVELLA
jgi:hypothetical protein